MSRNTLPVAVHLFLVKQDEILLLRRFNTGYEDGNYSVCAGHVEFGEVYYDAMIREAKEEIGITLTFEDLKPIQVMHRKKDDERIDYFFLASTWQGEIENKEPDKCDALTWVKAKELPENTVAYIRYAIDQYLLGESFTHFGWGDVKS